MALRVALQAGLSSRQAEELLARVGPVAHYEKQPFYLANSIGHAIQRMKKGKRR